ncbi:MAG: cupin domain-containing protein [Candidatus Roizmanbacteria bacterium]|nr:cupin domain-containing protein [Candidatus Roizmanbacteria bacterium]
MFAESMKKLAGKNTNFRSVLHTGTYSQLVAMSIPVQGDIGEEIHDDVDQILLFLEGTGTAVLNGEKRDIKEDDLVIVRAGTKHNFINTGDIAWKLLSIYAPSEHPDGTVHKTKADAQKAHHT